MSNSDSRDVERGELLRMAVEVVSSYVGRNQVAGDQIPELINTVYRSMAGLMNSDGHEVQESPNPRSPYGARSHPTTSYAWKTAKG